MKIKKLVVIIVVSQIISLFGQSVFDPDSLVVVGSGFVQTKKFDLGDFNGDGTKDVVVASNDITNNEYVTWIRNDANNSFQKYLINNSYSGVRESKMVDLDQDGILDVVAGSGTVTGEATLYWINSGSPEFQSWDDDTISTMETVTYTIGIENYDSDSYPDLVIPSARIGNPPGEIVLVLNSGSFNFSEQIIENNFPLVNYLLSVDVDQDSYPDIVANSFDWNGGIRIYYHDGNRSAPSFTTTVLSSDLSRVNGMAIGDLNKDGEKDIAAITYRDSSLSQLVIFYGLGNRTFNAGTVVDGGWNRARTVDIKDFDGDGDEDLLIGVEGEQLFQWYENDGTGNFTSHLIDNLNYPYYVYGDDFDGDGDMDAFVSSHESGEVRWYKNNLQEDSLFTNGDLAFYPFWNGTVELSINTSSNQLVHVFKNDGDVPDRGKIPVAVDHLAIKGYYTITSDQAINGGSLRFHYDQIPYWNDYEAAFEEQLVMLWYDPDLQQWIIPANQTVNTTDHYIQIDNLQTSDLQPFSYYTLGTYVPDNSLPVNLISFGARLQDERIMVEWSTASESNILGFVLERKVDDFQYELVSSYSTNPDLRGVGNTNYRKDYVLTDMIPLKYVSPKRIEYRLSVVEIDGSFSDRFITGLDLDTNPGLISSVEVGLNYPNPFNPTTSIPLKVPNELIGEPLTFYVYNLLGELVHKEQLEVRSNEFTISWNILQNRKINIVSGHYFYKIIVKNQSYTGKMTLIK
ncbi:MAG: hypothetical protein Kow00108_00600 [Calditrichia bacterium]